MPAEGARFGEYVLKRRLARGGMGEIWLAERRGISGFSKQVVIKTILEAFSEDEHLVEMFLREGRIAAELSHPNIAQTFDLGCVDGVYYMAMELVDGRDLREILIHNVEHHTRLPLELVMRIMAEVCQGLYYAHTRTTPDGRPAGIIHRDISPQNIIVTFDGGVKIIDFGVAKAEHMASLTRSGVLKGKYAYMSPEQIRGEELDGRSDVFSAGVVMYELITCRRLFKRNSEMATLEAVMRDPIPFPAYLGLSIPGPVEAILERALERDREQRFQDARQMQTALEQAMLRCNLVCSSTHLSEYMKRLFPEGRRLAYGRDISRRMDRIPSV
ncbi:MAG: serine/threonine protein kinase, partial [Deltaproteobacteria bacterium]